MVVRKYLTVLSGKYPANLYRIPDSAGCLNFTGYRYPDPAHPYYRGYFVIFKFSSFGILELEKEDKLFQKRNKDKFYKSSVLSFVEKE